MATTTLAKSLRGDRVSGLRLRNVCSAAPADPIRQVVACMADRRTGCVLVRDEGGKLVGIFTERDFLNRVVATRLDTSLPVGGVMTSDPKTISRNDSVSKAVELMGSGGYRHLPVLGEDGQPVGVLSVKDIVHYLVEYFPA